MPAYHRIHIDGSWNAAGEAFSTSFGATADSTPPDQGPYTDWAQAIMNYLRAGSVDVQQMTGQIGSTGTIDRIRLYWHPSTSAPAAVSAVSSGLPVAGAGTIVMPPQITRVYTLVTGVPGRSFRGRMYWPRLVTGVSNTFRDNNASTATATAWATILSAMTDLGPGTDAVVPAVVSKTRDLVTPVTAVQVGDVLDTQRRRRDNLRENRFTANI